MASMGSVGRTLGARAAVFKGRLRLKRADQEGLVGVLPGVPVMPEMRSPRGDAKALQRGRKLRRYDKAYLELKSHRKPSSRSAALTGLHPALYDLGPELQVWTGDIRLRIDLLVRELLKDLDNEATANASIGLFLLILAKGGRNALEMIRPIVREKIAGMYRKQGCENIRYLPRLMLTLDDYNLKLVEQVTKNAIHSWSAERFSASAQYLGYEDLKQRGMRGWIRGLIAAEIANAGVEGDATALKRAIDLYHSAA